MRLLERTRADVWIAPRVSPEAETADAFGARSEQFGAPVAARGALYPVSNTLGYQANTLAARPYGEFAARGLQLMLPADAPIAVGDGVYVETDPNDGLPPDFRAVSLEKWSAHLVARLEKRAEGQAGQAAG